MRLFFLFFCFMLPYTILAQVGKGGPYIDRKSSYSETPTIINPPRTDGKWPGLRYYDAIYFCQLVEQAHFIMWYKNPPKRLTVTVKSTNMRIVEKERLPPPYPDGEYESRWDVIVNGEVIDPRQFAIEYRGQVMNLGTLFTYAKEFYPKEQSPLWQE